MMEIKNSFELEEIGSSWDGKELARIVLLSHIEGILVARNTVVSGYLLDMKKILEGDLKISDLESRLMF